VIEVNRATKEVVWQYHDKPAQNFFSPYISGAQRLPNGNTLIIERRDVQQRIMNQPRIQTVKDEESVG
jgi:hypothetical protein